MQWAEVCDHGRIVSDIKQFLSKEEKEVLHMFVWGLDVSITMFQSLLDSLVDAFENVYHFMCTLVDDEEGGKDPQVSMLMAIQ